MPLFLAISKRNHILSTLLALLGKSIERMAYHYATSYSLQILSLPYKQKGKVLCVYVARAFVFVCVCVPLPLLAHSVFRRICSAKSHGSSGRDMSECISLV